MPNFIADLLALSATQQTSLAIAVGILFGVVSLITMLVLRRQFRLSRQASLEQGMQQAAMQHQAELDAAEERLQSVQEQLQRGREDALLTQQAERNLQLQLEAQAAEMSRLHEALSEQRSLAAAGRARLEEAQKGFAQREALFRETSDQMKKEFELLANRVFESQEEKHQAKLQTVLSPFREQIVDFRKRVEEVYHTETKERASLLSEVRNLQKASDRINEEAENLTKALRGDKKLQGNWGELVLERVLEESGLRKDHEYFLQSAQRNTEGDLRRPDVLIQLPDNKDVVIDSKVSLNSYEQALASEDDGEREMLIKQHLVNMRSHVKRLSEQDYDRLPDVRSLDFVLLFVPIESAFTLAMENDPKLFSDAFHQRIVIVSPTTLMMTLRIINNVWRYEKQNRNAQDIAKRAGALYDKLRGVVEDMDALGKQLTTAEKTYSNIYAKLASGKGNLVRQVEHFRELGAQVKKPMDAKLIDKAEEGG